jgi:hypothetical protein
MAKTVMAVVVASVMLLTGFLSPCMAAPLASQTANPGSGEQLEHQSDAANPSPTSADTDGMEDTVVGDVVSGVTNTQLVVIGLVVILLIAVIAVA